MKNDDFARCFHLPSAIAAAFLLLFLMAAGADGDTFVTTTLYSFTGGDDGAHPQAALTQASDGNLYGTTAAGGSNNLGAIFRLALNHTITPLYSFTGGIDGSAPEAGLAQATDGNLYGTTSSGGSNSSFGTLFRISTNGVFEPLYSFTGNNDGGNPKAGLVQAGDGFLYGTAYNGGSNFDGTVFRISTNGAFNAFYSFTGSNDGSNPFNLVKAANGNIYGAAYSGGTNGGNGTIFQVATNGTVTGLYSFTGGSDGANPEALMAGGDGNLYGTANQGGDYSGGAIFRFGTNGVVTPLYSFTGGSDGYNPEASLIRTADGNLYGTAYFHGNTFFGGSSTNYGSIFQLNTNNIFSNLYLFSGLNDGADPYGGLMLASDGTFYGTTSDAGQAGNYGTIFNFVIFPPPVNDNFTNRSLLSGFDEGYNFEATVEPNEPAPGGGVVGVNNTVWWTWTAPTNGTVSILTAGSSFDTIIDVYTGSVLSNLALVTSNLTTVLDNELYPSLVASAGLTNRVSFTATAGTHYQVQVSGLSSGTIDIAAQTTAIKVLSNNPLSTNTDGSIPFNAMIQVGNSGLVTAGPLQVEVLARAGVSYNTANFDSMTTQPPARSFYPADRVLTNYYLANPPTVAPGTTTNILISGICPGPIVTNLPGNQTNTLGFGWGIYVVLNEEYGTNWFFDDNALVFYGTWPLVGTIQGPSQGVIRLNPGVSGSTPVFQSAQINGPQIVNQNSLNTFFGTANFVNGTNRIPVNFTNTVWTASRFSITNGLFQTGSVATNTPVTLTALYSYDYYGQSITNTNQYTVLVLKSPTPSLGFSGYQTNHAFALTLSTMPSTQYIIEAATNLTKPVTWTPLSTNTTDTNGNWSFSDAGASNRPTRFYRAKSAP